MFAFLLGVVPVGAGLGSLVTPLSMKILTRRNILLVCNSVAIVIAGVIQINNIYVLLGCRFVQGLVIGHYMGVIPLYVK
jgi:MFS family permease